MNYIYKVKAKTISASIAMAFVVLLTFGNNGKLHYHQTEFYKSLTTDTVPPKKKTTPLVKPPTATAKDTLINTDTVPVVKDSMALIQSDTIPVKTDSTDTTASRFQKIDTFDIRISKDTLSAPVYYHADDSVVVDVPGNKIMLYGEKSNVKYEDNDLTAPGIVFDQGNNMLTAAYKKDSTGKVIASPTFKQADFISTSDTIKVNMKTGKGITKGTYTQQGEMYVYGQTIKKINQDVFFSYRSRMTTCNLDTPHFAFVSKKIKFINKKFAVTGPVHPEFEGVPIPIVLPFGIYPLYQGRHSGLIAPNFTSTAQYGLALERLGYYKVFNDNWDATFFGTIYSYGGWAMQVSPRYFKRYRYTGNFVFDYMKTKIGFKGDPDFYSSNDFKIRWQHSMDTKSRPGVTFSASVNAGTSSFNSNQPTAPLTNFQNQMSSSINYSKRWGDRFNMSVTANHDQNTNTGRFNITLPNINFNMNTIYPLRPKETVGTPKWYENLGIGLNSNALNKSFFYDDTVNSKRKGVAEQYLNNMQWGVTHSVPISLSLPPLGPLQASPGVSYSEVWLQQKTRLNWNDTEKRLDTTSEKGFYTSRSMSFSFGMSTRIFGMFTFKKTSKVQAIRHEIRPTMSFSFTPDMNSKYYYKTQVDTLGRTAEYNYFGINNLFSPFSKGRNAVLSFGIDNNVQMKVRDKKDTSENGIKKVTLIDGFSINSGYNFLRDSLKLSPFSLSFRTNLFNKISISGSGTLNPYKYDTLGHTINKTVWRDKILTLGRLTSANLSISSSFQGGDKKEQTNKTTNLQNGVNPYTGLPLTDEQEEAAYIANNPAEYVDFSLPWSVQFGLSFTYGSSSFNRVLQRFTKSFSSNLNLSGSLRLTEKWQLSMNTYYNFTQKEVGLVSVSISREMHCWQMSINLSPIGRNKFFSINISPKSSLLRDLKINRTKYFRE